MFKGHKNVAVLTCAKELQSIMPFDRADLAWLSSHGMDVSLQSFQCLFRLCVGGILDSGPPLAEDFRTACVHAHGGYILASSKVKVSPQCPICYLALRYVHSILWVFLTHAYLLILK